MANPDNATLDRIIELAAIFDTHIDQEYRVVPWEEMKAEIDELSETEKAMLLGLVKPLKKTDELDRNSSTFNDNP